MQFKTYIQYNLKSHRIQIIDACLASCTLIIAIPLWPMVRYYNSCQFLYCHVDVGVIALPVLFHVGSVCHYTSKSWNKTMCALQHPSLPFSSPPPFLM